jgi:hypothetical protein
MRRTRQEFDVEDGVNENIMGASLNGDGARLTCEEALDFYCRMGGVMEQHGYRATGEAGFR